LGAVGECIVTALEELAEVLVGISTEVGNLSIRSDGEVRRRISALVIEGRVLIQQLEVEAEVSECRSHGE
jgi:hypothetical protein